MYGRLKPPSRRFIQNKNTRQPKEHPLRRKIKLFFVDEDDFMGYLGSVKTLRKFAQIEEDSKEYDYWNGLAEHLADSYINGNVIYIQASSVGGRTPALLPYAEEE